MIGPARWLRRSLAARMTLAFVAVGAVAVGLATAVVNLAFEGRFATYLAQQQVEQEGQLVATLAASHVRSDGWDPDDLDAAVHPLLMEGAEVELRDSDDAVVWHSDEHPMAPLHPMHGSPPLGEERSMTVSVGDEPVGTVTARLPRPGLLPVDAAFRSEVNQWLVIAGLAGTMVALGLGIALARRTSRRAERLGAAARAQADGDRSARVPDLGADELGEVAASFNRMAEAVESQDRLRRGFAADVAHELRTPLAVLQGRLETIQDGLAVPDPDEVDALHAETLRLSRLVADLEALASADAAAFTLAPEQVDLADLVTAAAAEHAESLHDRDVTVEVTTEPVSALVDPTRLRQVLGNLMTNAAKFTPDGGWIAVRLRLEGDAAVVEVADDGPGVPEAERGRVFDRFYRAPEARASGTGIGLTIVRDLVAAHGGTVGIGAEPGAGARVTVRLPVHGSHPHHAPTGSSPDLHGSDR